MVEKIVREVACSNLSALSYLIELPRRNYQPTFDVASVKLFSVVLLPEDGLPTKPIKGSRGIFTSNVGVAISMIVICDLAVFSAPLYQA
jgi:hypothetical protein